MPEPSTSSYLRAGVLTATVSVLLSFAVSALFVVIAAGSMAFTATVRSATQVWLVSVGSGLEAGEVSIGLVPLGATVACIAVVARVARWIAAQPLQLSAFAATTAGTYGVLAAIASALSNSADIKTSVIRAAFAGFVVAGVGAALGMSWRHKSTDQLWFTDKPEVRGVVRAAVPGALAVIGAAGVIVVVLLVQHLARAGDLWAALAPGFGGGIALAAVCLLMTPTLVLWTVSVLLGPGFALGVDTSVDLTGAQLGIVPGLPILAALPSPGEFPGWVFLLGLVPLAGGMLSGWRLRPSDPADLIRRVMSGAVAGGIAGILLGVVVGISGGSIGPGRMSDAGPSVLSPLLVATSIMAVGGALGAALAHYRWGRAKQPAESSAGGRPRLGRRHQPAGADRSIR